MSGVLMAIQLLGGLAMFLYGMEIMGDGLKQGSGAALKNVLGKLTQNVFLGFLVGAAVTAVIQSSTATVVLTVGLIGAGILNLRQAVGIVMGANVGTTVTAWIVTLMDIESGSDSIMAFFKPDTLAPVAMIIGIVLIMFVKKAASKNVGIIAMGFGILFIGLNLMTAAVEPLSESEVFTNILTGIGNMPLVGILVGLVLTVIVQSSSAMVGILQALSSTGVMTFGLVAPIIMGINLGTCVTTAMVCSIGSSKDAKRTGIVHIVFNTIGTVIFMAAIFILQGANAFPNLWGAIADSTVIAIFQTVFNLATAFMLLPFSGWLVKVACKLVKEDPKPEEIYPELAALDAKLMTVPAVALGGVASAAAMMASNARDNIARSLLQFDSFDEARSQKIDEEENRLDHFTDMADNYLIQLSVNIETDPDDRMRNMLMQCIRDIERIGDYASDFDEAAKAMAEKELVFSDSAKQELAIISDAIQEIIRLTVEALETDNEYICSRIEPLEEVIDDMVLLLKNRHTARLCQGKCSIDSGLFFMDMLTSFERAADHCSSIAMQILSRSNEEIMKNHHEYLQQLHESDDKSYLAEQENRRAQYLVPLENITF
ncbi:MAG: Na/Pi cotransporter family protein [Clostridia bacterium]|nr:Na/Pi cotransporter family protein [Clostridia bacterium]